MVFKSFLQGWGRVSKFKKMWLFLFLVNILFALLLAIPMQDTLKSSFGNSLVEDNMRKGYDYRWYRHFQYEGKGLSNAFFAYVSGWGAIVENLEKLVSGELFAQHFSLMTVGIIYMVLNIFFMGGIIGLYNTPDAKFTFAQFFSQAGTYFWRFIRLFIISLPFYILLVYMLRGWLSMTIFRSTIDMNIQWPSFLLNLGVNLLALFLLCLINMIFDYAKISTVAQQGKSMLRQTARAIKFVFKNFSKTLRLYYLLFIVGIILVAIYALIEPRFDQAILASLIFIFLIQQLFILGKIWIRLAFYARQLELFKKLSQRRHI